MILKTQQPFVANSLLWSEHFRENLTHMDQVPWDEEIVISADEKSAIAKSIATFQLGENSEGNSFRRAGEQYAKETGDREYLTALDRFIKEENRHSDVLARFMEAQSIPKLEQEWTDNTFRFIRKIAGLNICISVLLTAEIVAAVFYRALGRSTNSPVLRAICNQILIDEAHHLVFQAGTLAKQRRRWFAGSRWVAAQFQKFLMLGTILVVWREHGPVYRAGGFTFLQMARETWKVLEDVLELIRRGARGALLVPADTKLPAPIALPLEK